MRRLKPLLLPIIILLLPAGSAPAQSVAVTPACVSAYHEFINLHPDKAAAFLRTARQEQPANLLPDYLEDYDDFLNLLLQCDPALFRQRRPNKDRRLKKLDALPSTDRYARFCRAGILFHWAMAEALFDEQLDAALDFRKAYQLLRENQQKFPDFQENAMLLGILESFTGVIPDDYKWMANMIGLRGSLPQGVARLSKFLNTHQQNDFLYTDAAAFYAYIRFHLQHQREQAFRFVSGGAVPVNASLFLVFIRCNITLNFQQAELARQLLTQAKSLPNYRQYPVLDYELGNALYYRNDPQCLDAFNHFIRDSRSIVYVNDARRKAAYAAYLQRDMQKANAYRASITQKPGGLTDADKLAQRFATGTAEWPNRELLSAHLYADGGYYKEARKALESINANTLPNAADKLEYNYLVGKVWEVEGDARAIAQYALVMETGAGRKEQYAARAALNTGYIWEKKGNKEKAGEAFRNCLKMKHHDFKSSIDQQAKSGLSRLGMPADD